MAGFPVSCAAPAASPPPPMPALHPASPRPSPMPSIVARAAPRCGAGQGDVLRAPEQGSVLFKLVLGEQQETFYTASSHGFDCCTSAWESWSAAPPTAMWTSLPLYKSLDWRVKCSMFPPLL
ncbi:hypothetical protein E2C01_012308 [Portunus trituberculatus]|uniref:Uncharacterized protein n=1 Tax=Portunus trituberculatus TaxID=210409 RepID=A0A5B7DEA1_PORTR|nr:hypothetical protein [Portunus trituberculatus]